MKLQKVRTSLAAPPMGTATIRHEGSAPPGQWLPCVRHRYGCCHHVCAAIASPEHTLSSPATHLAGDFGRPEAPTQFYPEPAEKSAMRFARLGHRLLLTRQEVNGPSRSSSVASRTMTGCQGAVDGVLRRPCHGGHQCSKASLQFQ